MIAASGRFSAINRVVAVGRHPPERLGAVREALRVVVDEDGVVLGGGADRALHLLLRVLP